MSVGAASAVRAASVALAVAEEVPSRARGTVRAVAVRAASWASVVEVT